ncbi:hypothetical protein K2173_000802 [Erythroxylum novogranatense]|uniref:RING-type domain-containing protein n=1 Tax=Erythroxylum novogranatense TaxID=1862640 RepID=A0AAV8T4J4_9ROSI|nr:hypothetical protein K2173_000802 [Erythroxylum novogranatense]
MPAQKRSFETTPLQKEDDDLLEQEHSNNHEEENNEQHQGPLHLHHGDDESDRSPESSTEEDKQEFVMVKLSEIRREVQCPICLGIIRKTRTVMECLHRFCRECIDKSMRLGNNECPACRTHCASRRSLRDDPNYDALISALYPDIDKYEEEELAFHEEEKARNKQIQDSIAQTIRRQAEALGRKKTTRATAAAFARRTQGRYRDTHVRGRRNYRTPELQESDDNEDANEDGGKDSSSADEHSTEVKPKRSRRWAGGRSAAASADGGGDDNDSEINKESMGASAALVGSSERLAWGKGGIRSHTRYGGANAGNGKNARNSRLSKLADYLRNLEENDDELDIHLMLVSLDEKSIPSLRRPYLSCRPTLSVKQLCQYVALQTALQANEVEIHLVKELNAKSNPLASTSSPICMAGAIEESKDKLQLLDEHDTLAGLKTCNFIHGYLVSFFLASHYIIFKFMGMDILDEDMYFEAIINIVATLFVWLGNVIISFWHIRRSW